MLNEKKIIPDPRLECLIDMIGECDVCADIGSDHGRLGACLLQMKRCGRVIMTDISDASLQKARRLVRLLDLDEYVTFAVGNGLSALDCAADVIVIAGMGGDTIASIMGACSERDRNARFLLQPNVAIPQLRTCVNMNGFAITDENLVREGRRIYTVLQVQSGVQTLDETETEVGPVLLKKGGPLLADYSDFRLRVLAKALTGANRGRDDGAVVELERQKRIWEDTRKCL